MPLWLQGIVELVFTAALSFGLVLVLLMAVWFTNGFNRMDFPALATLASHLWLLMHGVPLNIPNAFGIILPHGMLTLVPMGLSIIPVLLCFRSGRKLARASYEGEFFKPVLLGCAAYGIFAAVAFAWASTERHLLGIVGAALIPQIVVLVGLIWGGYYESRSLARMVGVNTAEQISQMSQYSRWASSYVWSIVRASMVAIFSLIMGGALVLVIAMMMRWSQIATIYQELHAGPVGALAVTLLQLGYLPNLVIYAMSWTTGAGFAFGVDTHVGWSQTTMGDLPLFPVLGAIPESLGWIGYAGLAVSLGAGVVAGWWFLREGEDHVDEWITMKVRYRVIALPLSSLVLGSLVGVLCGVWAYILGWISSGSLGVGRFTEVGASPAAFAVATAITLGAGTALGNLLCHVLLPDSSRELPRFADERPNLGSRMSEMLQQRRAARAEREQLRNDEQEREVQEREEQARERAQQRRERVKQVHARRAELNKFAEQEEAQRAHSLGIKTEQESLREDGSAEAADSKDAASDEQTIELAGADEPTVELDASEKSGGSTEDAPRTVKPGKREKAPGKPVFNRVLRPETSGNGGDTKGERETREQSARTGESGSQKASSSAEFYESGYKRFGVPRPVAASPASSDQESTEGSAQSHETTVQEKRQLTPTQAMAVIFGTPESTEDESSEEEPTTGQGSSQKKRKK